ncbi:mitochondrial import inner membrane translocase subunit Tim21 isoform X1 [Ochotona curzoniae]|uniref:mitochondrial import inner membrane translocase subunit Tim21 isoform X1 n=1 Tax=Ochotona curzoniae TaxID=130825 RepID=UPI001B3477F6|nr:mitochondrial import inner membrane translocase subunit Tim21 isoform X1 [Ochotona curzoniae]XP_040840704.1 mitochondrial import inner membrane translocase subunit Tim21 isoform X1 [Ochotona curzoniae]
MTCQLLRALRYAETLHGGSGKRLTWPHLVLRSACVGTGHGMRWGLQEPRQRPRPKPVLGVASRAASTQGPSPERAEEERSKQVSVRGGQRGDAAVSTSQKVKEAGRDLSYFVVVLVGIGVTGGLFYTIFKELFSASSPSKIYGKALEKCRSHPEVTSVFGEPVRGYGETTRRGRRQHVSFIEYVKDGLKHMRVKFYIEGSEPGKQGTVHAEVKENPKTGDYDFRYIFVEIGSYPGRTVVVEDNRAQDN